MMDCAFYKVPAAMLMGFGSHFGPLISRDWNSDSSGYIQSRLNNRFLINLSISSVEVSKAIKFIHFFISRKLRFLYFLHEGFKKFLFNSGGLTTFKLNFFFLVGHWISGVLTNYKTIQVKLDALPKSITNLTKYPNGLIFLGSVRFLNLASRESRISKCPSIGLVDMDNGFAPFSYSIPSNNKSFSIYFAYFRLFHYATLFGSQILASLYAQTARRKLLQFIKKFSYFFRFRSIISGQRRVYLSRLAYFNFSSKGFRFFYKIFNRFKFRLKFQRLYIDLFVKATLPKLKGLTRLKYYNKIEKVRGATFYQNKKKQTNKFTKNPRNNKFTNQKNSKSRFYMRKKKFKY